MLRWRTRRAVGCALVALAASSVPAGGSAPEVLACGGDFKVHQLSYGNMKNFQYLLQSGDKAVSVDAAWDIEGMARYLEEQGLSLVGALYTHQHADHVGGRVFGSGPSIPGAAELRTLRNVGRRPLPLWIGAGDVQGAAEACQVDSSAWTPLSDGEALDPFVASNGASDGSGVTVVAVDTPGHTKGGLSLLVLPQPSWRNTGGPCGDGLLFTGDTLFVEAAGRTDLPGGNPKRLLKSLGRLAQLPLRTVVLPGHDYGPRPRSNMEHERSRNPFMQQALSSPPKAGPPPLPEAARLAGAPAHTGETPGGGARVASGGRRGGAGEL